MWSQAASSGGCWHQFQQDVCWLSQRDVGSVHNTVRAKPYPLQLGLQRHGQTDWVMQMLRPTRNSRMTPDGGLKEPCLLCVCLSVTLSCVGVDNVVVIGHLIHTKCILILYYVFVQLNPHWQNWRRETTSTRRDGETIWCLPVCSCCSINS